MNEAMPSVASAVPNNAVISVCRRAMAASSPCSRARCAEASAALTPSGAALSAIVLAMSLGPPYRGGLIRHHLLHEADAVCLCGIELVAGQDPAHRIPPSGQAREPDGGTPERIHPPSDLHLAEAGAFGRDADVGRQQELDACGHAPAVRRRDHRFGPRTVEAPGIPAVVGNRLCACQDGRADVGKVETGGEVVAVCEEHPGPQGVVRLQQRIRPGQVGDHRQGERVALIGPVQSDGQHVTVAFQGHRVEAQLGCCHQRSQSRTAELCKRS